MTRSTSVRLWLRRSPRPSRSPSIPYAALHPYRHRSHPRHCLTTIAVAVPDPSRRRHLLLSLSRRPRPDRSSFLPEREACFRWGSSRHSLGCRGWSRCSPRCLLGGAFRSYRGNARERARRVGRPLGGDGALWNAFALRPARSFRGLRFRPRRRVSGARSRCRHAEPRDDCFRSRRASRRRASPGLALDLDAGHGRVGDAIRANGAAHRAGHRLDSPAWVWRRERVRLGPLSVTDCAT